MRLETKKNENPRSEGGEGPQITDSEPTNHSLMHGKLQGRLQFRSVPTLKRWHERPRPSSKLKKQQMKKGGGHGGGTEEGARRRFDTKAQ